MKIPLTLRRTTGYEHHSYYPQKVFAQVGPLDRHPKCAPAIAVAPVYGLVAALC